ncbi:diaminopimelate epimerase [Enterobacteriaceae endosymbiont of Plateumaris sericea]|uniref:diaminopimelate epimerase n=1 Tax=Enterobacteriaceae endosymbiont of Plateumaris sericea TaxID=2675797 RepID=UPI00144987A9|nr:diaminopimelate epimerase [Enterobacteriaceae endosymbiont of Plateumaris sericea]QJC30202.1 diaminopimelate epimerase [Enterobacteriaceae endosymbiont of Plateumaris sericea]
MKFSKMHALSNDFVVINNIKQNHYLDKNIIKKLSNRYTSIGFDQLLLIELSNNKNIDFHYRIFNSDGNEVNQCGNGARCFAKYVNIKKLTLKKNICISTNTNIIYLKILENNKVCVNMGIPLFDPKSLPFLGKLKNNNYSLFFNKKIIKFDIVSLGNPHCIIQVNNIFTTPVKLIGSFIQNHKLFPNKVNVGFMEYINSNNIKLRVFERGVGETNACGTGACAAVAVGINKKLLSNKVKVNLIGGSLNIKWKGDNSNIFMKGDAHYIYDGEIDL